MLGEHLAAGLVLLQMLFRRLIGNVEIALLINSLLLQVCKKRGQEGVDERAVFVRERVGVPAEEFFLLAVHLDHNLGRVLASPLTEEMRKLKIFNSLALTHIHPAVEHREVKVIGITLPLDPHELCRHALTADIGIELGGENRRQDHIDPVFRGSFSKSLDDPPMSLGEGAGVVILRQAVGVEPLGVDQSLLGQGSVQNADGHRGLLGIVNLFMSVIQRYGQLVFARRHFPVKLHVDP